MKCVQCGASLSADSQYCSHCGSRNDVDLTLVNEFTVVTPESERLCPECDRPLQTVDIGRGERFLIEQCPSLHGLFFDNNELDYLLDQLVRHVYTVDYTRLESGNHEFYARTQFRYRNCPVCRKMMNRRSFGVRSGVVVDTCRDHGIWLDAGKLRQLCEWRKAGGQLLTEPTSVSVVLPGESATSPESEAPTAPAPMLSLFSARRRYWVMTRRLNHGGFLAECPDIPGLAAEADSEDEALRVLRERLALTLKSLRARGELTPPARTRCQEIEIDPEASNP